MMKSLLATSNPQTQFENPGQKDRILRNKTSYQTMGAPNLMDDFYLNLVSWSSKNTLAVGLDSKVHLQRLDSKKHIVLCKLRGENDAVASVNWNPNGFQIAVGSFSTGLHYYDTKTGKKIRQFTEGLQERVSVTSFRSEHILASGKFSIFSDRFRLF